MYNQYLIFNYSFMMHNWNKYLDYKKKIIQLYT